MKIMSIFQKTDLVNDVIRFLRRLHEYWNWQHIQTQPIYGESVKDFGHEVASSSSSQRYALPSNIEREVEGCLNTNRDVWCVNMEFNDYKFATKKKGYPDIVFRNNKCGYIAGVEVKAWNILATVYPANDWGKIMCAQETDNENDILVMVPWFLEEVIRGKIVTLNPFVMKAQEVCALIKNEDFAPQFRGLNRTLGHLMVMQPWINDINQRKIWGTSSLVVLREIIKQENLSSIEAALESISRAEQETYSSIV